MGYFDDYDDVNKNRKIPYDDTPIIRQASTRRNQVGTRVVVPKMKLLVALVSVLLVVNIVLIGSMVYFLKNSVVKNVNYNNNNIIVQNDAKIPFASYENGIKSSVSVRSTSGEIGSGIILKKDSSKNVFYILTCYHVVDKSIQLNSSIQVKPYMSLKYVDASVVGYLPEYDVAILKSNSNNNSFDGVMPILNNNAYSDNSREVSYELDSRYLSVGDDIFTVGNAMGRGVSVTEGIISQLEANVSTQTVLNVRCYQFSAPTNPGNSGGGLFNSEGRFVGLVNAKAVKPNSSVQNEPEGISYAIPGILAINIAKNIIDQDNNTNNISPKFVNLGVEFSHDKNVGFGYQEVSYNGHKKMVEKYRVYISSGNGQLNNYDVVNSFKYIDKNNKAHTVTMFNKFSFEEIMFNILDDSVIEFNISKYISGKEQIVKVLARNK